MDNRELIIRAITDPTFRKQLEHSPKEALGLREFTERNRTEVRAILDAVAKIDGMVSGTADMLLCR